MLCSAGRLSLPGCRLMASLYLQGTGAGDEAARCGVTKQQMGACLSHARRQLPCLTASSPRAFRCWALRRLHVGIHESNCAFTAGRHRSAPCTSIEAPGPGCLPTRSMAYALRLFRLGAPHVGIQLLRPLLLGRSVLPHHLVQRERHGCGHGAQLPGCAPQQREIGVARAWREACCATWSPRREKGAGECQGLRPRCRHRSEGVASRCSSISGDWALARTPTTLDRSFTPTKQRR